MKEKVWANFLLMPPKRVITQSHTEDLLQEAKQDRALSSDKDEIYYMKKKKNSPRSRGNMNQHPSNPSTSPSAATLAVPLPQPGPVTAETVPCTSQPISTIFVDVSAQTQSAPVESTPSLTCSQPKSTATAVPATAATPGLQKTDRVYKTHMKLSFSESYLQDQHEKMSLQNKNLNAKKIEEEVSEKVQIVIWNTRVQAQNVKGQPHLVSYSVPPGNVCTDGELAIKINAKLLKAWEIDQPPVGYPAALSYQWYDCTANNRQGS
ncbi:uncharacterized protein PHACADRAFT_201637 [Phanerochaete carnosa HHB-10118-sp]|uniref:Uncharacterized protein n=1 Tax=Phanerochaete carnosa (strain HHB-10118-sp) TaxID=650164 RepID=K5WGR9_PHACS|nr:uncharacterized protein PHACADRAFT_201637 [Phanerochaete carnosa HHB-10118-sp]EKM49382.1 hypothetical protein PHACADRAFT_201637 [Phanerochaete carnosa HHB-10118-sp]